MCKRCLIFLSLLAMALWGCGEQTTIVPVSTIDETAIVRTVQAVQTLSASQTAIVQEAQSAVVIPVTGGDETPVPATPAITRVPTNEPGQLPCDWVAFVKDVTIPDDSVVAAGEPFTKTWQLKNVGTCTWTNSYSLVFIGGNLMQGAMVVPLRGEVLPGNSTEVSVELIAPVEPGTYRGDWQLGNTKGEVFGLGAGQDGSFWVKIRVPQGEPQVVFDFAAQAPSATWKSSTGEVTFGSTDRPENGLALVDAAAQYEDGNTFDAASLLVAPDRTSENGAVWGVFPAFEVQAGDRFYTILGCKYEMTGCNAQVSLAYRLSGSEVTTTLETWQEVYNGSITTVSVDLSVLKGSTVELVLKVISNGDAAEDQVYLLNPRVMR